jgi:hypothetical protein
MSAATFSARQPRILFPSAATCSARLTHHSLHESHDLLCSAIASTANSTWPAHPPRRELQHLLRSISYFTLQALMRKDAYDLLLNYGAIAFESYINNFIGSSVRSFTHM